MSMSNVVILDANDESLEMLGWYLSMHGHDVRRTATVPEAFNQIEAQTPDAIIVDLDLAGMTGHEFLRMLRHRGLAPNAQVVVLGADSSARSAIDSWELGVNDHLVRPVRPEVIADALARQRVLVS